MVRIPLDSLFHRGTDTCHVLSPSRAVHCSAPPKGSSAPGPIPAGGRHKTPAQWQEGKRSSIVLQMQTFCRKQHSQEEFLYRKGGQALAGAAQEVMEPPALEVSKE